MAEGNQTTVQSPNNSERTVTYSLVDLEDAKATLHRLDERYADYSGNNPDKYDVDRKQARTKVRIIEDALKASGVIQLSEREQITKRLDLAFPNARSKQVVEFEGRHYRCTYVPFERSRSRKTVKEWHRRWDLVEVPGTTK